MTLAVAIALLGTDKLSYIGMEPGNEVDNVESPHPRLFKEIRTSIAYDSHSSESGPTRPARKQQISFHLAWKLH